MPSGVAASDAQAILPYVLGIDGGGTHTVALLAAPGANGAELRILGRGEGGPSNLQAVGTVRALEALDRAVGQAFAAANLERAPVQRACLGLAGAGRPVDQQIIHDWGQRIHLARDIEVTGDGALILPAGTTRGWGIAVVAGTGSIVMGRAPDGRAGRTGGWGYLLDDKGSGYALVMNALQAVMREADGRGLATTLTSLLLPVFNLQEPSGLVNAVHGAAWDRTALSRLAPVVIEAANAGDQVAREIVDHHIAELALAITTMATKLQLAAAPIDLALAGGLLLGSHSYRERLLTTLRSKRFPVGAVTPVEEPAIGAVRMAFAAEALE